MNQGDTVEAVIVVDHIYRAPVSQPIYGQFCDGHEIRVVIQ